MAHPRIVQFANMKGWTIENNTAYGEEKGYPFTLENTQGKIIFGTPLPSINNYNQTDISDFLKENKIELGYSGFSFHDDILYIEFPDTFDNTRFEVMNNMVEKLTGFLGVQGVKGKEGVEQFTYANKVMPTAHGELSPRQSPVASRRERRHKADRRNYVTGFIGSLIGGVLGSVPWILIQTYLNRISTVFALFIGIGALVGYFVFKGKPGPAAKWIIGFCTLFSVVFSQFGSLALDMIRLDIPLEYNNFIHVFELPGVTRSFISNMALSLLISFLSLAVFVYKANEGSRPLRKGLGK